VQQWEGTAKIASPSATPPLHTAASEMDIYISTQICIQVFKKQLAIVS
jgi:hypothetical protein